MRMWRTMFSISTMASSTSTPATKDNPSRVISLSVKSIHCMKANVGMADKGIASAEMTVARQLRRKNQTTTTASIEPSISELMEAS